MLGKSFHRGVLVNQGINFFVKSCEGPVNSIIGKIRVFDFLQLRDKQVRIEIGVITHFFPLLRIVHCARLSCDNTNLSEMARGVSYNVAPHRGCFLDYLKKNVVD